MRAHDHEVICGLGLFTQELLEHGDELNEGHLGPP